MSKLNIFQQEWIDMVFEGRNKAYGAYELRAHDSKTTTRALLVGAVFFVSVIAVPVVKNIINQQLASTEKEVKDKVIEAALLPPPPKDEALPPPPPPEPPKSINDQVKFPPPKVVEKEKVKDEDPPTVQDLEKADPGQKNIKGDPKAGDINIDTPSGEGPKGSVVTEDPEKVYVAVEVQAEPPGGMEAFYKRFAKSFTTPEVDGGITQIRFVVGFVVEKDGSFTDIRVLRDGGYPEAGKEAIRVLKKMPNWKPAIHNGNAVRSQFALPIVIKVQ
ncbi:energy transducer TonB [Flavobacterium sp. HXWNR69]|uniref:Energy transducer TonB n=1 Tax=Flavobacterium fragile TaxID=2949085 RepID=A0ABT0TJ47_9FLAO|nr:energy transducer TonB [Flavobacterium sp. HXWNR69]MCL9771004.1 energy transducer TonB [Flavobacterium sp. HXWNR69]